MKHALVIGASGGIGQAVSEELAARSWMVRMLSRTHDGLDITQPDSVDHVLNGLDGPFDLIFVATGILAAEGRSPEKSLDAITLPNLQATFAVNTFGPALVLRHASRLLAKDGKLAILTARVGSIGDNHIGGWYSYRASKAAANQIVHGAAIELSRSHRMSTVVALHPGTVETPFTADYAGRHKTVPAPEAARHLIDVLDRLGPDDTGNFFDYAGEPVEW